MDKATKEYAEAIKNFIELSQNETRIRVSIKNARARVQRAREEMRAMESEAMEPKSV